MAIKRYVADADNTITNAFDANLTTRGTGSNMGAADSLEVFSIYGQISGSTGQSSELSRILVNFPAQTIINDRAAGTIPASGSVNFYLKMYNAEHPFTLARDFTLVVSPISQSWQEGSGLDMEEYKDLTYNGTGSNWLRRGSTGTWSTAGGNYLASPSYSVNFPLGWENLTLDISTIVEDWLASPPAYASGNNGVGIRLIPGEETAPRSYYTKKFFARSSEFFFKRPAIEARWDSRIGDDRGNFYFSSSLAPASDNLNTLYLYNYVRGRLVDIPSVGTNNILLSLYSGSTTPIGDKLTLPAGGGVAALDDLNVTGAWVSTGVYSASFAATGSLEKIFDVWHSGSTQYFTCSVAPKTLAAACYAPTFSYITALTNLKANYSREDTARFRFFVRQKNWNPNMYVVATNTIPNESIVSASYKVIRLTDDLETVPYGTGSDFSTYMSYDEQGNYFDLDMSLLEAQYMYGIKVTYYNDSIRAWVEQPEIFKFRVEE